ncbi:hypothetical protein ANCCEY_09018 [Ancylostoma ceylanicum]|uniref:Uncharacterized protein n=1 Tax=Ancylostoma ceylanicum TaxID=53326 RepID=A0A0D6LL78_9BILA|nr:hypothetical protein ANCCEY_09018 [Ancylostoma ceylanicum]
MHENLARASQAVVNREGYFMMADDSTFNFWHKIDLTTTMHPSGGNYTNTNLTGIWWPTNFDGWFSTPCNSGCDAVKRAVHLFEEKYKNEKAVQAVWDQYQDGTTLRLRAKSQKHSLTYSKIDMMSLITNCETFTHSVYFWASGLYPESFHHVACLYTSFMS